MPPLSWLVFPILTTLTVGVETPFEDNVPAPMVASSAAVLHTPSTLHMEVGDERNARFVAMHRGIGLLYANSAQPGIQGVLHLSLLASYSHTNKFPELVGGKSSYSKISRWMGTFSAAYVFLPWLEAYGSYEVSSSFATMTPPSGKSSPVSGQILGDTTLGTKATYRFVPSLYGGLDVGLRAFNVGESSGNLRFAFRPAALLTWNVQQFSPDVPLIAHSNFGFHLGRYSRLLNQEDASRAIWQTFSWNLSGYNYAFLKLALESPLPCVTPFLEYQANFPFWGKGYVPSKANPQSLAMGAKITVLPNATLSVGVDFNLKSPHVPGVVFFPPWRLFFGISLATAPSSSVPVASQTTYEEYIPIAEPVEPSPPAQSQLIVALKRGNKFIQGQAYVRGPNPQSFQLTEATPSISLPPGPQAVELLPDEGLAFVKRVNLAPGQAQALILNVENTPPGAPPVRLVNQRILFGEPLAFSATKAELTPQGQMQMRNLVNLLIRNHIRKIRIESHVESQRMEGAAMLLSAQRAQVLVDALGGLGINPERIEVLNLGDSKPVAPNTVRAGRLLNRRIELFVVESWDCAPLCL